MDQIKKIRALGLMSGTSLDGVNVAAITTDGVDVYVFGPALMVPYDDHLREQIRSVLNLNPDSAQAAEKIQIVSEEMTQFHARVACDFIRDYDETVDLIGFHGHTISHDPQHHYTYQLGNGQLLADLTGIKVVSRFHHADILAGGQGAPLLPVFYNSLAAKYEKPVAFLNIGGITSLTWIGRNGEMIAFDVGPGNAPVNDWVLKHAGQHMDYNGKLAISGQINGKVLAALMRHKFFAQYPPKSIDRNIFQDKLENLEGLSLEDGAATATAFVAEAVAYSCALYLPELPKMMIVCGGGANNPTMIRFLRQRLPNVEVKTGTEVGLDCEAVEAQAYGYMAVRRLYGLPNTFPATTGVPEPIIGGEIYQP